MTHKNRDTRDNVGHVTNHHGDTVHSVIWLEHWEMTGHQDIHVAFPCSWYVQYTETSILFLLIAWSKWMLQSTALQCHIYVIIGWVQNWDVHTRGSSISSECQIKGRIILGCSYTDFLAPFDWENFIADLQILGDTVDHEPMMGRSHQSSDFVMVISCWPSSPLIMLTTMPLGNTHRVYHCGFKLVGASYSTSFRAQIQWCFFSALACDGQGMIDAFPWLSYLCATDPYPLASQPSKEISIFYQCV